MDQDFAVHVKNTTKHYGSTHVLEGLNMEVERGIIYGLLGSSGCGKSTLLNILVGRTRYDEGDISVLGKTLNKGNANVLGPRVGYMPQETALVASLTVQDTLVYFGRIYGMSDTLITEKYEELHNLLELPPNDRFLADCSGGEKRRVSFAAAVIHKPELLILDEPTVGVDPILRSKIWNYIVDLTIKEKITVIITTHYIEECRKTDKIGLMRRGKIIAEDSPNRLLAFYNSQTLEEVFFLLSKKQDEGSLSMIETNQIPTIENGTLSNFEIEDGYKEVADQRKTKVPYTVINRRRLRAMLDKNWKQFYRNTTGIFVLMFVPMSQVLLFLIGVGGNIKDIPIGIVNAETDGCSHFSTSDNSSCQFYNMSCKFLTYLNHPMMTKVDYDSLEEGKEAVRRGYIAGVMYFPENFTTVTEKRINMNLIDADDVIGDPSQIKVWMDMSNRQIGETIKYKLIEMFMEFQKSILEDCGFPSESGELPFKFNFVYGNNDEAFIVFMLPGILVSVTFLFGAIMTCQIIVLEREEGIWDRSIVAGVTSLEITFSHLILQFCLALIPIIEFLILIFAIFQYTNEGSLWLISLVLYMTELSGMSFGYFVSVIANGHIMSTLILCGAVNTMILTCGMIWPLQGMPTFLRMITTAMPFTIPIQSSRNIMRKGWTIDNLQVLDGILASLMWITIFGVSSVLLMKKGR